MGVPSFGEAHVDRYRETDGEEGDDWQDTTVLRLGRAAAQLHHAKRVWPGTSRTARRPQDRAASGSPLDTRAAGVACGFTRGAIEAGEALAFFRGIGVTG